MATNLKNISAYPGGDVEDNQGWKLTILEPPSLGVKFSDGVNQVVMTCYPPENPEELEVVITGLWKKAAVDSPAEAALERWLRGFDE